MAERLMEQVNRVLVHQRKSLVLILVKQSQNFAWVYIAIMIIVIFFYNRKEINKFKANNKNGNFPTQFCLGSISSKFDYVESEKLSLKGSVYDF